MGYEGRDASGQGVPFKLGADPVKLANLTGQRKLAAAALPYVKLALIGAAKREPRELGDDVGVWPMKLVVTTDVADSMRLARRQQWRGTELWFEAWVEIPRDEAQKLKETFDGALNNAGRQLGETSAVFDVEPEMALQGLLTLCQQRGVCLYDNSWYDAQVDNRAARNARMMGGRR